MNRTFKEDDLFKREKIAQELSVMISETKKPFSIAIDSYWGSGKSTFLIKWKNMLEADGHKAIYIDAWKMDYYIDPIIPIVGSINELLELQNANFQDVKSALLVIMKDILQNVTKINYDEIINSFSNMTRESYSMYKNHEEQNELIYNKLSEYAEEHKKVYVFIDELDRCKPLFAINFLERIKHFLSIPNFVFVFSVDLMQLGESIKHVYGNINVDSYFRKFFDITYNLPVPTSRVYFEHLVSQAAFMSGLNRNYIDVLINFTEKVHSIGLRECEKIFEIVRISNHKIVEISGNEYIFPILILTKVLEPNKYKEFIRKEINWILDKVYIWKLDEIYSSDLEHVVKLFNILGETNYQKRRRLIENTEYSGLKINQSIADMAIKCIEFGTNN